MASQPTSWTSWYGYQVMLNDLVGVAAIATGKDAAMVAGFSTLLVGPAAIHGLHRRPLQAVLSPVMRTVIPLLGAAIGSSLASCGTPRSDDCESGLMGAFAGASMGFLGALIIDWSVFARENERADTPPSLGRRTSNVSIVSGISPTPNGGASVVLGGRF